ncbi:MAG: MgtC/SapB family protein [Rhizobiales bacterium]|nr:MgtC/SapB family protein [Hyphomicrobiales bacterium]
MRFLETFALGPTIDSAFSLFVAFILGTLVGAEREYRQRSAGLRTNTLVAVGAAAFVDLAQRIAGDAESVRVISYVVSGIGFLGAGVIMKDGANVRGLNTAATLWCSAAIGACAGSDMMAEAVLVTLFVLAGNTLLRPLVARIERAPVDEAAMEARFELRAMTDPEHLASVRRALILRLNAANYPVGDIEVAERGDDVMEVTAVLVSTAVVVAELERVTSEIAALPGVADASWERSTLE